jgi:hypothetical protein
MGLAGHRGVSAALAEFRTKRFNLLWRDSRDGFTDRECLLRCDGRASILTLISNTDWNVFGEVEVVQVEPKTGVVTAAFREGRQQPAEFPLHAEKTARRSDAISASVQIIAHSPQLSRLSCRLLLQISSLDDLLIVS